MTGQRKRIIGNFFSLSVVQGLSVIFPLLIFPYLLRKLGVEGFGIFSLIQTVIVYADLFVSFGFSLSATKAIARNTGNRERTNDVIVSTYLIKTFLFIIPLLLFVLSALLIPSLEKHIYFILLSSLYVAGNLLFPDWYFQGIQKMSLITIVTFISKCLSLVLILFWVKGREDVGAAIFALSIGNFIAGIVGFGFLLSSVSARWKMPARRYRKVFFMDSAMVFSSIILVPLYSSVNIFILRYFTNPLIVGYYAVADKIYGAISMLTSVANRTFYPHLAMLYKNSVSVFYSQVRKISLLFFGAFSLFAIVQFSGANYIIELVSGKSDAVNPIASVGLLKIMSLATFFAPYGSFFFQLLIIQGRKKTAVRNLFVVVLINTISAFTLSSRFGAEGMAFNLCIIVILVGLFNFLSYRSAHNILK